MLHLLIQRFISEHWLWTGDRKLEKASGECPHALCRCRRTHNIVGILKSSSLLIPDPQFDLKDRYWNLTFDCLPSCLTWNFVEKKKKMKSCNCPKIFYLKYKILYFIWWYINAPKKLLVQTFHIKKRLYLYLSIVLNKKVAKLRKSLEKMRTKMRAFFLILIFFYVDTLICSKMHVFSHACMCVTVCIDLFYNIFTCAYSQIHTHNSRHFTSQVLSLHHIWFDIYNLCPT